MTDGARLVLGRHLGLRRREATQRRAHGLHRVRNGAHLIAGIHRHPLPENPLRQVFGGIGDGGDRLADTLDEAKEQIR
ncbi:MAG: hypothetical protein BWZ07_02848 [Alphaproteobacteria bacterium ADurb.BinA280]|nr:MAG: hypothetical protein BWZ07_02848 [Alphaproteobacteria bacterium ADurb.BinA280]